MAKISKIPEINFIWNQKKLQFLSFTFWIDCSALMENKIVFQNTVTWGENDSPMLGEQERHCGWSQHTSWRGDLPSSAVYTLCLLWIGVTLRISHSSPHFTHHTAPAHSNCSRSYHQWVLGLSLIGLCRHHDALYLRKGFMASWHVSSDLGAYIYSRHRRWPSFSRGSMVHCRDLLHPWWQQGRVSGGRGILKPL